MNKFILILFSFIFVDMCICVSPSPSLNMRSEALVKHLHLDISSIFMTTYVIMCLIMLIMFNIDLNCRYIPLNMRLNILSISTKEHKTENLYLLLLFSSYLVIFEYYFIAFLPCDFWRINLDTRKIRKKSAFLVRMIHSKIATTTLDSCHRLHHLFYINIAVICNYPLETLAIWIFLMRLALCPDIHPNPGPCPEHAHSNLAGGFYHFVTGTLTPSVKMISLV